MSDLGLHLYRDMFLCRHAEESIAAAYMSDVMKTPMHMSMGSEAIAAAICQALSPQDQLVGTYRSHAIYLCRTGETGRFFAEMYGKSTGMAHGKGGSMHITAPESGLISTSAIVATGLPVAVGAAFANQRKGNQKIVAVFFGDGAVDEGVFWESLNAACLWRLPVLFVCEDNGLAVHTPSPARRGFDDLPAIVERYRCSVFQDDTTDVELIHQLATQAIQSIVTEGRPAFLQLRYYRYLEHVGVFEDFKAGYRDRAEFEDWKARDPLGLQRERLLTQGRGTEVEQLETEIREQVQSSIKRAEAAPYPEATDLYQDLFA
jgi:pyruvate dehydrogenase E1 component alpha subunit